MPHPITWHGVRFGVAAATVQAVLFLPFREEIPLMSLTTTIIPTTQPHPHPTQAQLPSPLPPSRHPTPHPCPTPRKTSARRSPLAAAVSASTAAVVVPAVLVAECGLCHDGEIDRAREMVVTAAQAGANAVKFQKRSALAWFEDSTPRPPHRVNFGRTAGAHRAALEFTVREHIDLRALAHSVGVKYGLSVWDRESAHEASEQIFPDFVKIGRPFARTAESALVIQDLLAHFPPERIHISCRTAAEAAAARRLVPAATIYYCPGNYPDRDDEIFAAQRVALLGADGISLHTRELYHATAAVAVGARFVEHHFALAGTLHADAAYSLSPEAIQELAADLNWLAHRRHRHHAFF